MAKTKKKNAVHITSVKSDNKVLKKGVKTTVVNNKKPRQNKKKAIIIDELKKEPKKGVVKKTNKITPKKVIKPIDKDINTFTQEEIIAKRKEKNRKKYENQQKKYRDNKEKKKIVVDDTLEEKVINDSTVKEDEYVEKTLVIREEKTEVYSYNLEDEQLEKKVSDVNQIKSEEKVKEEERKEKRKTNRKTPGFTQTITNTINDVREITKDTNIPTGKTYDEKTKRSKRLIKEAIVYAIIFTIIDVLCITFLDYFNYLRLFDVKSLNIALTVLVALIFNFFVAFMVDYFVTNIWLNRKRKKKDGEQNGDSGSFTEEYKKNRRNKKRK